MVILTPEQKDAQRKRARVLNDELTCLVNPIAYQDRLDELGGMIEKGFLFSNFFGIHFAEYSHAIRVHNAKVAAQIYLELLRKIRQGEGSACAVIGQRKFLQELCAENLRKFAEKAYESLSALGTSEEEIAELIARAEIVVVP